MLASRSPRRAELLRSAGYRFRTVVPGVHERLVTGEPPVRAAERLAARKALDVARRLGHPPSARVLGADTLVVAGRRVLGKPPGPATARRMLRILSGRSHRVVTGLALWRGGRLSRSHAVTTVTFRSLTPADIDWYVGTGDPMDKAGGYGIQGGAALFVTGIRGSWTNVVGLPLERVFELLGLPP